MLSYNCVDFLHININILIFFLNLALKIKLYLSAFHAEETDCQFLLFYYDEFLKKLKYDAIKLKYLKIHLT